MQLMGGSSLLAKASTAFQAAAAKADRAITELKAERRPTDVPKGGDENRLTSIGEAAEIERGGGGGDTGFRQRILFRISSVGEADVEGFRQRILLRKSSGGDSDVEKRILAKKPEREPPPPSAMSVIEGGGGGGDEELKAQDFWKRSFISLRHMKQEPAMVAAADPVCDSPKKDPAEEEDYKRAFSVVSIPPSLILRRLAAVTESEKSAKAIKTVVQKTRSLDKESTMSSGEWASLVNGFVSKLSQKDGKFRTNGLGSRGRHEDLMWALFETPDCPSLENEKDTGSESGSLQKRMRLPQEIHGAPPESFVAKLGEIVGSMKSEQKMAEFWMEVMAELRRRWCLGEPIPRIPIDESPDLGYCSLHQQLQLINCCMARRKRRASTLASLPEAQSRGSSPQEGDDVHMVLGMESRLADDDGQFFSKSNPLYVRHKNGQLDRRLGADRPADDLKMLETGEPVYSPLTQDPPLFTEDSIREAEELVLRTGSVGAGCSHLLSDMQAFKAANPGCILEDFVRWYSPPDWREDGESGLQLVSEPREGMKAESCLKGCLSVRMQSKGNLWQELWSSARPIPAVIQSPLFDEELAGESTLDALENLSPPELFRQLFTAVFSVGYAIAEGSEAAKQDPLKRCLQECSDFIVYSCGSDTNGETLEQMCRAYEALEAAILEPLEEVPESQGRQWLSTLKAFRVTEKV